MRLAVLFLSFLLAAFSMAETEIKISTLYPPGSDAVRSLTELSNSLKEKTAGEVVLKVYPGGVMGDDKTVMRKIRVGQLQGALVSSGTLDLLDADLNGLSKPFSYDNLEQVYQQRLSYDSVVSDKLKSLKWYGFGPLDGGFSYLMSKNQINNMEDIRQSKLWLPNSDQIQQISSELDIDYLVMNIGDVLTGLDTGAIDTLISPPSAALALNWHSRFQYLNDTPVLYTWGILIVPERALARLDVTTRNIVTSELEQWSKNLDARSRVANQQALKAIQQLLSPINFDQNDLDRIRLSQTE